MTLIAVVNENNYHRNMDDPEARALLAGTLALMTLFAESRCPFGAERIWSLLQAESMPPVPGGGVRH